MGWEFAAVGGAVVLFAGIYAYRSRMVRKGHEAAPRLEMMEAQNEELRELDRRRRKPRTTVRRFRDLARRRVRDAEARED